MDNKTFDIKIRCYKFSLTVMKLINELDSKRIYNSILNQLLRSATSVGANMVEAQSASSKKDFIKYLDISLKSANETKYWLCLIRDGINTNRSEIEPILEEANEISKIIASSLLKLKNKK